MNRLDMIAQTLSNIVSNDLTHVSVPTEDIKHALKASSTFVPTHAPSGPALPCPIMPIIDQYFHTHSSPTSYSQSARIMPPTTKAYTILIVVLNCKQKITPSTTKQG
jgi:hypothetical protein